MNDVVVAAPRKISAIIPQTVAETAQLAEMIFKAGMAPKGMNTPAQVMISIMRGMEVGLAPFQSLEKIPVVNGRALIMGEAALAIVRASGKATYVKEWLEGEGDKRVAHCEAQRGPELIHRQFSAMDAKKAGLWGKGGPWSQYPDRMLTMRARAFALRDGFADLLGGLYLAEEFDGTSAPQFEPEEPSEPITAEQIIELQDLMTKTETKEGPFLKYMMVPALTELDSKGYKQALTALNTKLAKIKKDAVDG